ncbi:MAG: SH3 domain-containing protein [Thermomicrobiales bacterium]|nr:SH3 domain-containing protein [Thermomicrobiales bacterium]
MTRIYSLRCARRFGLALALTATIGGAHHLPGASAAPNASSVCADAEEARFLDLLNAYRAQNGLGPLALSQTLSAASEFHSTDMAAEGYFDHTMPDGTTVEQNLLNFGYEDATYGENIVAGTETADSALQTWQGSAAHNANMLRPAFTAIGIGRAYDPASPYGWYWTTIFGGDEDVVGRVCGVDGTGQLAVTNDDVNLRYGPGLDQPIDRPIPAGIQLTVTGEAENGYLPVLFQGEDVWAAQQYIDILGSQLPAVDAADLIASVTVNLREAPDRQSTVLAIVPAGADVEPTGQAVNGYVQAIFQDSTGWIDDDYLSGETDPGSSDHAQSVAPKTAGGVTATAIEALNLRDAPSREGGILTVMPAGATMTLTGDGEGGYFSVRYGDLTGWADAAYLH